MNPDILFEDEEVLVCYKPAGMPTQSPNVTEMDMVSYLKNYRIQKGEADYIGVIQRLDQPVEGILAFAKNQKAAANLSLQVQNHKVEKLYYAIITRGIMPDSDTLVDYMVKDGRTNKAKVVKDNDPRGKKAVLHYQVVDTIDDKKLIEVQLETGRHHQIRAQLASRTAPIFGDAKYGGVSTGRPLCLCSYKLSFAHPATGEKMTFQIVPKGEDFQDFAEAMSERTE